MKVLSGLWQCAGQGAAALQGGQVRLWGVREGQGDVHVSVFWGAGNHALP